VGADTRNMLLRKGLGDNPGLAFLFVALLLFFVLYPIFAESDAGLLLLDVAFSAILIIAAYAVSHQRKVLIVAVILALPTIGSWLGTRVVEDPELAFAGLGMSVAFFGFILVVLLRNIIESEKVTVDLIYGAMSVYLLIGLAWASLYSIVELAVPGAFDFGELAASSESHMTHGELRFFGYFSFVTLSTLGYGDITPVTPFARSLSALEAIVGQLYIAVLIARIVGMHIAQKDTP